MKKSVWIALLLMLACMFSFSACDKGNTPPSNDNVCQHAFGDWNTTKQATCKDDGELARVCSKCSVEEKTTVAKTNVHIEVIDAAVSATCEATGLTEGKHCSYCDKVIVEQTIIEALGHKDSNTDHNCDNNCGKTDMGTHIDSNVDTDHVCDYGCGAILESCIDSENDHNHTCDVCGKLDISSCSYTNATCETLATCTECGATTGTALEHIDEDKDHICDRDCGETTMGTHIDSNLDHKCDYGCQEAFGTHSDSSSDNDHLCDYGCNVVLGECYDKANDNDHSCDTCGKTNVSNHNYNNAVPAICAECGDVKFSSGLVYLLSEDETYYIVSEIGTCTDTNIVIPSVYNEKPVLGIGGVGFNNCDSIISVTISEGVVFIADYAFAYCSNLASITFPNSITSIGEYAFSNCDKLKNVKINDNVTSIGMGAFAYCPIETATIPTIAITNVTNSHLKTVVITSGNSIENGAFSNCDNLISVTIADSVTAIGNHAFSDCDKLETILIPNSVTTIGDHAFSYCRSLENINIPQGVTTIGNHVLSGCDSLKSITIPNTVTSIGDDAFYSCNTLTSVVIPDSVVTIGENAFNDCRSLKNITIGNGVTYIGSSAFWGCPIETASVPTIVIPNLTQNAYILQNILKTLVITGGDTIENSAFENFASLTSVSFSASVKNIGDSAFAYCENLANIEFGAENQLERIGEYAFMRCKGLTTVVIAEGTQPLTIGTYAFANCNISNITIPSNVVNIEPKALKDCACISVNEGNSIYTAVDGNLYADNGSTLVQYATNKRETTFEIPSGVRKVAPYAFMNSQNLVSITIPSSVTSIGVSAFEYCDKLSSVTFSNTIGWYCTKTEGATSGINLSLDSNSQIASLLKDTYAEYYWYTAFTGHNYTSSITAPTCTEQGYTTHTCNDCGDTYTDTYVAALGHDEVEHIAKPATCTEEGYEAYVTCSRCDYSTYKVIEKTGHAFGAWGEIVAPTEEFKGEERRDCSVCDYYETRDIPELDHQHKHTQQVTLPTCTEQGFTTYICACGDQYVTDYVAATGHSTGTAVIEDVVNSTCTTKGSYNSVVYCTVCESELSRTQTTTDALGHTADDAVVENSIAADCGNAGSFDTVVYCTVCEAEISRTQTVVNALGHALINHEAHDPSCTEIGWQAYATCSRCDYSTYQELPASHHYENWVCSVCGDKYYSEGLTFATYRSGYAVSSIGSCADTTIVIPDTYDNLPVIAILEGAFRSNQKIVEVIIPDSVLLIEDEAFSYSKKLTKVELGSGVVEIGMAFAGCDGLTTIKIPASVTTIDTLAFYLAKNMKSIEVDDGNSAYSSLDGILYNKDKTTLEYCPPKIEKTGIVIPSTVTTISSYSFVDCLTVKTVTMANGVQIIENSAFSGCKNLESIVMSNNITKIQNYAFEECSSLKSCVVPNGVTWIYPYVFRDCSSLEWIYISKNIEMIYYDPFDGCSSLKTVYFGGTEAEWNAISYSDSVPSYIGINIVFEYDMSCNHEIVIDEAREPTCTLVGLTEGSHCKICNTVIKAQEEIAKAEHNKEILPSRNATCSEVGLTEGLACTICGEVFVEQDELPKLAHTPTIILPYVAPSCSAFGWTEGTKCSVCQEIVVAQTMISKTAHNYINGVCDDCGHEYASSGITFQKYASYNSINRAAVVTGYTGSDTEVYIPQYVDGYIVIGIESNAFKNNTKITKVIIPGTVRFINGSAFRGCSKLVSINIPEAVTTLSGYTFMDCTSLESIVIPNTVTSLGDNIFNGCTKLASVTLSNKLTEIPLQCFLDCSSLTEITIPSTVTKIKGYGFGGCSSLSKVEILGEITAIGYSAFQGCSSLKEFTIPSNVKSIESCAFNACDALEVIIIPSSVTSMSYGVFRGCDSLTIYCEVEYEQSGWDEDWNDSNCPVVWGCNYVGDYITEEGFKWEINSSNKVTIVDFVTVMDGVPVGSKLTIPSKINGIDVTEIAAYAFDGYAVCNGITELIIPDTINKIGEYAFIGFNTLESVTVPNTLTVVEKAAFNCTIKKVVFDGTKDEWISFVTIVGEYNENLTKSSVYLPNGQLLSFDDVKYLEYSLNSDGVSYNISGAGAFNGSTLTIPSTYNGKPVTVIGSNAFYGCPNINELIVPSSIQTIEQFAFAYCEGLEKVTFVSNSDLTTIGGSAFSGCSALKSFAVPSNVISIGDEAFCNCGSLNEFTFASDSKIKTIGQYCFTDCNGLMSIIIPKTVTSIGERAFWYCYKLIEVYNLSSLSITKGSTENGYTGYYALHIYTSASTSSKLTTTNEGYVTYFDSANSKYYLMGYKGNSKDLVLPSKINNNSYEIYQYAFANTNIESVTIPVGVTKVGASAFKYCEELATVTFSSGFNGTIGDSAFMECNSLKTFTIPSGTTTVYSYIFRCHSLETIYVPNSVTKLDMYAFAYNENLKSIYFDGTKAEWNAISKWRDWDLDTGNYTVYCTDGNI